MRVTHPSTMDQTEERKGGHSDRAEEGARSPQNYQKETILLSRGKVWSSSVSGEEPDLPTRGQLPRTDLRKTEGTAKILLARVR